MLSPAPLAPLDASLVLIAFSVKVSTLPRKLGERKKICDQSQLIAFPNDGSGKGYGLEDETKICSQRLLEGHVLHLSVGRLRNEAAKTANFNN